MTASDRNFDEIADKFVNNIYGTSKGQLRHELLCHYLTQYLPQKPLRVLDAGGGTGKMTEFLVNAGHQVTLLDISKESLSIAKQSFANDNVTFTHGGIDSITDTYDVIICHAVLEWLVDPLTAIDKLYEHLMPEGMLSLSFFNRDAAIFGNLLYGNFSYVKSGLKRRNTVRLNPQNPQSTRFILDKLLALDLNIIHSAGIRCIHDYMKNGHANVTYEELVDMEIEYGQLEPYKWLGKYFHVMATKRTCVDY